MAKRINKPIKAWAGFSDGKLHIVRTNDGAGPEWLALAIFKRKSDARKQYEDVRPIEIREIKP